MAFVFDKAKVEVMSESDALSEQKSALRQRLRSQRAALKGEQLSQYNRAIASHATELLTSLSPKTVSAYMPMAHEPGGSLLIDALLTAAPTLLLPVVAPERQLLWASHTGTWNEGVWGIKEPAGPRTDSSVLGTVDLAFVPAQAVDKHGYRLGQGGGYYDRALSTARPRRVVAVVFPEEFLHHTLPTDDYDQPVDQILTPEGLFGTM